LRPRARPVTHVTRRQIIDAQETSFARRLKSGERVACHSAQPECVVEFAVRQQSRIGGDHGAAKLHHQTAVEIELESPVF